MKKQALLALIRQKLAKYSAVNVPLVIGVSGGPDSMALLDLLRQVLFPESLVLVHVNYGLRKTAARDTKLVEKYALKYGLRLVVKKVVLGKEANAIEEKARDARYKILRQVARENKAPYILVAHNADDQAETVLFNLVRGGGLRGLGGMKEVAEGILRPLLGVRKADLLQYVKEHKVPFAVDESNKSTKFTRNFLRHKVIPELGRLNPGVVEQLMATANNLQDAESAVRDLARLHVAAMATAAPGTLEFPASKLLELTAFMRAEVLKFVGELLGGGYVEWSVAQFAQFDKLLQSSESQASKRLGGKLLVKKRYDKISISLI